MRRLIAWARDRFAGGNVEKLRFLVAGGVNTVVGNLLYPVFYLLAPSRDRLALAAAQLLSLAFAYTNYKLFVFRTRGNVWRELVKFCPIYLVIYAINWAVYLPLVAAGLPKLAVQIGFSVFVLVASYLWHNRVTFRTR